MHRRCLRRISLAYMCDVLTVLKQVSVPPPFSGETHSQWKEPGPLPLSALPREWTLRGWMCAPCPAAGGVCFVSLCNAGPGRIGFHRYKSFNFNPITQRVSGQGSGLIRPDRSESHRALREDEITAYLTFDSINVCTVNVKAEISQ